MEIVVIFYGLGFFLTSLLVLNTGILFKGFNINEKDISALIFGLGSWVSFVFLILKQYKKTNKICFVCE